MRSIMFMLVALFATATFAQAQGIKLPDNQYVICTPDDPFGNTYEGTTGDEDPVTGEQDLTIGIPPSSLVHKWKPGPGNYAANGQGLFGRGECWVEWSSVWTFYTNGTARHDTYYWEDRNNNGHEDPGEVSGGTRTYTYTLDAF